jgi:TRAP-type C4-dicarboxylate transport system permease small subunit
LKGIYTKTLRAVVLALAAISGLGIVAMMLVTCADVIMRIANHPLTGAFDIVKICGAITIATSLPYTTALKGHVAIEYFFHKLSKGARIIVDSIVRLLTTTLFCFLTWQCIKYGQSIKAVGQTSNTLEIPLFWVPWVLAFSTAVVAMVILHNLLNPTKEMIKP